MQIRALTGIPYSVNQKYGTKYSPLNGIRTSSKIDSKAHNKLRVALAVARGAFLALVRTNIYGTATIINKASKGSLKTKWTNAWYNLGGEPSKLFSNATIGSRKKAILINYAPSKIKMAYAKNISGLGGLMGAGVEGEATQKEKADWEAIISASAELISQLLDIFSISGGSGSTSVRTSDDLPDFDDNYDSDTSFEIPAWVKGVAIGGLIYLALKKWA